MQAKAKGLCLQGDCTLLRALACDAKLVLQGVRRSHTCRARSVFCEVHAPAKHD